MSFFREVRRETPPLLGSGSGAQPSAALHQMASRLATLQRPNLLDLGPLCGRNIEFFASQGCRVFVEAAEDLRRLRPTHAGPPSGASRGPGGGVVNGNSQAGTAAASIHASTSLLREPIGVRNGNSPSDAGQSFPTVSLNYPDGHFDGILLWDVVDYLPDGPARALGGELLRISRPLAFLYLFSDSRKHPSPEPLLRYRLGVDGVVGLETSEGSPLGRIPRENRDLYHLFPGFKIVKCTLLRNQLREVLLQQGK